MDWIVHVNFRKEKGGFCSKTMARKIYFDLESKKEVLSAVKKDFPEYFENRVPQRTVKDEVFFATIFQLDEHWKKFWLEEIPCAMCGNNPVNRIDMKNQGQYTSNPNKYFCCYNCYKNNEEKEFVIRENQRQRENVVGYIYKITHKPTGKVYIGKTINFPLWRWWQHIKASTDTKFHEFMKENNKISDWRFETIDILKTGNQQDLFDLESKYIREYKATEDDYGFNTRD